MKRFFALVLAAVMAVSVFAGCGGGGKDLKETMKTINSTYSLSLKELENKETAVNEVESLEVAKQIIHEDIDRYIERLEEERKVLSEKGREAAKRRGSKKPVNMFAVPMSDEEFEKMVAMLEANKADAESQG